MITLDSNEPTKIGEVIEVSEATITVSLTSTYSGIAPIYEGELKHIGEVGSYIRIPQGLVELLGTVTEISYSGSDSDPSAEGAEYTLRAELIGEIDQGTNQFHRGVGLFPSLGDSVHFTTYSDLEIIFPGATDGSIQVGNLSTDKRIPVSLDLEKLVFHHSAIVGSTGSGKTTTVASLIQKFINDGYENSNVVIIDPHGEYSNAFEHIASIRSVLPDGDAQLRVPYWALPFDDILTIFVNAPEHGTFANRVDEIITKQRREFVRNSEWLDIDPRAVSRETPVPFDIHEVWHQVDYENNETVDGDGNPCIQSEGDPQELIPTTFEEYSRSRDPPNKGATYQVYGANPDRLRHALADPQLEFLKHPEGAITGDDPLVNVVEDWLGHDHPVSVLDFSGVPDRVAQGSIGVILNLLFELAQRSSGDQFSEAGIGRNSPILVVLEEAHRYLDSDDIMSHDAANRLAREGRKYGVGLMAVTQRPTEIPETAFSQMGTIIALRLTNESDQGTIKSSLPDTVAGMANILPSLRQREAIISGEAMNIPVRVELDKPNPWPDANEPTLDQWLESPQTPEIQQIIKYWREIFN